MMREEYKNTSASVKSLDTTSAAPGGILSKNTTHYGDFDGNQFVTLSNKPMPPYDKLHTVFMAHLEKSPLQGGRNNAEKDRFHLVKETFCVAFAERTSCVVR